MSKKVGFSLHKKLIRMLHRPQAKVKHLLRARRANGGGIHSPFLFRFVTVVLHTNWPYYAFETLESAHPRTWRKKRYPTQRLLFRIIQDLQPATMLKIGNPNDLDTQYMQSACPNATFHCVSRETTEPDDEPLDKRLKELKTLDFVLFSALSSRKQRLEDLRQCLELAHESTLLVFKYIHQTPEQSSTWRAIQRMPEIQASIDLFSMGIVFLRKDLPKCTLRLKL